jgi:hypothetical protein
MSKTHLTERMQIHLVIVQPDHYVHSLGFLDTADYLQYWLQKQGIQVTVAKNRLRHDAVNLVFGAHLGFHPQWLQAPYCTFFFNLEQIGRGGAQVSPAYQALLKSGPVIDYHPANVAAYRSNPESVPLIPFLNAPYLNPLESEVKLADRPIDLMFFGSINAERKAFLKRIEKTGVDIAVFDSPTYYHERDAYVSQAKAVINTSFYASARFEQVRAFNVLSQGTAFISYLQAGQQIEEDFRDPVFWINDKNFDLFFKEQFGKEAWCLAAEQKFISWRQTNPDQAIIRLIQVLQKRWQNFTSQHASISQPKMLVQAEDGRYFQDALNLSPYEIDEADLTMDLCTEQSWPWTGVSRWGQSLQLELMQLEQIVMRNAPETDPAWQSLCSNAMHLLKDNGHLIFELPMAQIDVSGPQGPQLKSGQRVIENFADRFWRASGLTHRLEHLQSAYLDVNGQPCGKENANGGRLVFVKRLTTTQERTMARVALPNFARNI